MPNFTPNSEIHIGRVPWDSSYRHTRTFASAAAQATWMKGRCTTALARDSYTYVRMNNAIRVPFNAESLYTYNYVMYKNNNYGSKWFYAFIVAVNYVNENMTELVLELDVMQTWYFDYNLKQCFVEREHVNDDTVGLHINPEPNMDLEYIYDNYSEEIFDFSSSFVVVLLNVKLETHASGGGNTYYASLPDSGDLYQNQYSACKAVLIPMWRTNALTYFKMFIDALNEAGAAESICDCFTVPSSSVDANDLVTYSEPPFPAVNPPAAYTLKSGSVPLYTGHNILVPTTLDGYTPKNNKLLCYPYCYLEVGDFTGRKQDYRWEFFVPDNNDNITLLDVKSAVSDGQGYITPLNYNGWSGDPTDLDDDGNKSYQPFTYDFSNKIPWVFSTFQTWMAQNAVVNQLAILGSTAAVATSATNGIRNAATQLGKGSDNLSLPAIAGVSGIASTIGAIEHMHRKPNTAMGNTGGNSKLQNGYLGWYHGQVCIRGEFARIVDDFLSMYGYEVDIVKTPNVTGRTSWNYVKTQNACNWGNVPADDMAMINSIYDNGITFWHVDDVGNYSLANTIVTP